MTLGDKGFVICTEAEARTYRVGGKNCGFCEGKGDSIASVV